VTVRDAWLLATGTLTAVRVPPPSRVDRRVDRRVGQDEPLATTQPDPTRDRHEAFPVG